MDIQGQIVAMLNDSSPMTRGRLCVSAVRKSGKKAYNLQFRRKTVQFVKAIPDGELDAYRRSTERCRTFLDRVQRFVDMKTKESMSEIRREAKDAKSGSARRPRGKNR